MEKRIMRPIPPAACDVVARWESCKLTAYPDPATNGEPFTIGYGHIAGVKPGQTITATTAKVYLQRDLEEAAKRLQAKIGELIVSDLTDNQYAALLSFVFNLGTGDPKEPEWTIWKRLRARQYDQVPGEMVKFVNANGKKLQGLVNRRTDEIRLWSTDEPGSEDVHLTSAVTREIATPPTPADPVPAHKSLTIWGAVTAPFVLAWEWIKGLLVQAPDFVQSALQAVNPFSDKSEVAHWLSQGLAGLGAVAGLYVAYSVFKKKNEARS
jgi:lysozyme